MRTDTHVHPSRPAAQHLLRGGPIPTQGSTHPPGPATPLGAGEAGESPGTPRGCPNPQVELARFHICTHHLLPAAFWPRCLASAVSHHQHQGRGVPMRSGSLGLGDEGAGARCSQRSTWSSERDEGLAPTWPRSILDNPEGPSPSQGAQLEFAVTAPVSSFSPCPIGFLSFPCHRRTKARSSTQMHWLK